MKLVNKKVFYSLQEVSVKVEVEVSSLTEIIMEKRLPNSTGTWIRRLDN